MSVFGVVESLREMKKQKKESLLKKKRKNNRKEPFFSLSSPHVRALRLQRVPDGGTADGLHVRLRQDARARGAEREDRVRR